MKIKQLKEPFVAVQQEDGGKFAIGIGNNLLSQFIYDEDEAEKEVEIISSPVIINFIGFMCETMCNNFLNKEEKKEVEND